MVFQHKLSYLFKDLNFESERRKHNNVNNLFHTEENTIGCCNLTSTPDSLSNVCVFFIRQMTAEDELLRYGHSNLYKSLYSASFRYKIFTCDLLT